MAADAMIGGDAEGPAASPRPVPEGTADVPDSLRAAWEEHKHDIVSEDGTTIDFGLYYDWEKGRSIFEYLTQEQLKEVTDAFVVSLLSAKVTSINLAGCCDITDACVKAIAATCHALVSLYVRGCGALTDESIKAIAANCPALELLDIQWCPALTHESIKAVPASCLVPESLREAWAKHKDEIVSEDGTTIDFGRHFDTENWQWTYKYFTQAQLAEVTDAFVV
ncbi:MAG: hypothetical protein AAFV01_16520, partial [Bacteroidota bacterium]